MAESSRPTRVLLVEDNELNRDMLSRRLARRGFHVVTAVDGEAAIQQTNEIKPDLILMDMGLPGLNGWDATRRIKANPETNAIPVIALTAHAMNVDREQALAAGCDAFETKPVELDRLLSTIRNLLSAREQKT
jgi:two-component system, cell cycle response regulator DivK